MTTDIQYHIGDVPPLEEILQLYRSAKIRCPVEDPARIAKMFAAADLVITARVGARLVGIARALTDFAFCCYLSELAVTPAYQRQGIGRHIISLVQEQIGDECSLMVLSARGAMRYYQAVGFDQIRNGFIIRRLR